MKDNIDVRYFDHAATTKINKEVLKEMMPYLENKYGNASSTHIKGIENKEAINQARKEIASVINADFEEIYFTSGGTESDNLAIKGFARKNKNKGNHIIVSEIEHKAILESCKELEKEGFEISYIKVDEKGKIIIKDLEKLIRKDTILISVMYANNEIGTIQPIEEIGKIARKNNIAFHTDAVQVIGNCDIDVKSQNIDMLSISSHKFYGPKGIGALYVNKKVEFSPIINGGSQEFNKRAGTENVANIVGMGKAIIIAKNNMKKYNEKQKYLSDKFLEEIRKAKIEFKINGDMENRLKGNLSITFKAEKDLKLVEKLSNNGICVSSASACNCDEKNISHVLKAIGLNFTEARNTIRITLGEENTEEDVIFLTQNIVNILKNE